MRRRRHAESRWPNNDPEFYSCPHCMCRDLTLPDRGTRDLQGRRLYQCTQCRRITSDELLMRASTASRLLD
jgi:hypothetical protein